MCLEEALLFNDRNEWRSWLEKNHRNTKEVWLLHYKKQSKKQTLSHIDAVEEALCFGWIDSKQKRSTKNDTSLNIHRGNKKVSGLKSTKKTLGK